MVKLTKNLFSDSQAPEFDDEASDAQHVFAEPADEYAPSTTSAFDKLKAIAARTEGAALTVLRQNVGSPMLEDDIEDMPRARPE